MYRVLDEHDTLASEIETCCQKWIWSMNLEMKMPGQFTLTPGYVFRNSSADEIVTVRLERPCI
jgi:hypothetical protein